MNWKVIMESSTSKNTIQKALQCKSYKYPVGTNYLYIKFMKNEDGAVEIIEEKHEHIGN